MMTNESQAIPDTNVEATLAIQQSVDGLYQIVDEFHLDIDGNLSRSLQQLRQRAASNEITLTVLGEFSSGKSTFINALLRSDLLKTGILPVNAVCTYISYSPKPQCEVTLKDGGSILVDPETVSDYSSEGSRCAEVERIRLQLPSPLLADGLVVVDTPGVNVNIDSHELMTASAIDESNACVYIMDCRKPGSKTTIDFLSGIQGKIGKFFFVLNRADIWDAEEQEEGLQFVKKALSEQCGITDSRVVLLSSTLARKPGNDHWNRCFEEFERDLNSFMRTERLLIIANEVAQQAFEVSAHAEHLLNSKWRLTEQALAGHHKRRLPDSEELIIKLRAKTLASIQNEAAITSKDFESVHEKYITNLRERVTNWVESARSKDSFGEAAEKSFERECEKVPLRLQYFLDGQTLRSHEKAQSAVAYEVSRLLNRVALLEDRAFFSRRSTYTSALCGGVAGLIVGFWTLSSAKSDFGALSMLLFVGSGLLFGLIVARNLWRASKRLPVPTRTRFSSGTHTIKLSHGFWGSVLGIVFPRA